MFYGPLVFLRLKNNFVESIFQEPSPSRGNWVLSRNFPLTLFRLVWKFRFKDSRSCVLFRKNNFVQTVYSFLSLSLSVDYTQRGGNVNRFTMKRRVMIRARSRFIYPGDYTIRRGRRRRRREADARIKNSVVQRRNSSDYNVDIRIAFGQKNEDICP